MKGNNKKEIRKEESNEGLKRKERNKPEGRERLTVTEMR